MIDEIDNRLGAWVRHTLDVAVDVSLTLPQKTSPGPGVGIYLLALSDLPPTRGLKRPPTQFSLRYLVTTWAEQPQEAHRLLGDLAFAALENPDWQVDLRPLPAELWLACGIVPQPSFVLCVPARRERPEPQTRYVREPLQVQGAPIQHLHGVLLGPSGYPLVGASVELLGSNSSARTDDRGRFRLTYVAASESSATETSRSHRLRIVAKGREMETTLEPSSESEPVIIRLPESLFT